MADMLKFRKGTIEQIKGASKVPGTIYIAKDEKAMYVDISADERIRIGDFVRVATVDDIPFPYSETAIYYVEADNALLGYKDGKWSQINGTEALVTRISAVEEDVADHEDRIDDLEGRMDTAENDIDALEGRTSALESKVGSAKNGETEATGLFKEIADLKATVGTNEDGESLGGRVSALENSVDNITTELIPDHEDRIDALEGATSSYALKSEVESTYVKKSVADSILAKVDTEAGVTAAITDAVAAEAAIARAAEQQNATAAAGALEAAEAAMEEAGKKTTMAAVEAKNYATKTEAQEMATAAENAAKSDAANKYALKTDLEATDLIVSGHTESLTTLTGTASVPGSVAEAKKAGTDAKAVADQAVLDAAAAQKTIDDFKTAHAGDYTNGKIDELVNAASGAAAGALEAANAAQDAADNAQDAADKAQGDATKALEDAAKAQKTADDYIKLHEGDYTNGKIDELVNAASNAAAAAQERADDAYELADAAVTSGELADAIKDFATTGYVDQAEADAVAESTRLGNLAYAAKDIESDVADHETRIKAIEDDYVIHSELTTLQTNLEKKIADDINAANAMEYRKGVASATELPASEENGATYVATASFTLNGKSVYAGDLLIATGSEDPDTNLIAAPVWEIVKTGYDATLEQEISTSGTTVTLSSVSSDDKGSVTFEADPLSAATVKAHATKADTIVIGMEWADFE